MSRIVRIFTLLFLLLWISGLQTVKSQGGNRSGTTEVNNGVKIVTNPNDPAYGEIRFDLEEDLVIGSETDKDTLFYQVWDIKVDKSGNIFVVDPNACRIKKYDREGRYLQSIGRSGEGPGEFSRPVTLYLDQEGGIFVLEMRKVHVFDPQGDFIRAVHTPSFVADCVPAGNGTLVMVGYVPRENGINWGIRLLDREGKVQKTIAEFPGNPFLPGGSVIHHDYTPELRLSPWIGGGFVYGYTSDYKLYCCDEEGKTILVISKKVPPQPVSRREKDKILDEFSASLAHSGETWPRSELEKAANMPKHRPFFKGLQVDDLGRIYVKRLPSVMEDSEKERFDVFSSQGRLLYSLTLPFAPLVIQSGFLYTTESSDETGAVRVIRYRIKNWASFKSE